MEPIVAIDVLPESHEPPDVASDKVDDVPGQTRGVPVIAAGSGLTVNGAVIKQPLPIV